MQDDRESDQSLALKDKLLVSMNAIKWLRSWTMRLPASWGLGQAQIHSSLLVAMGGLSLLVIFLGVSRPGFAELLPAALTLPVVWVVSLTVRLAAQHLVLGKHAFDLDTVVGPSGNLSTDYEFLPPSRILYYAVAGQLATISLILLGLLVNAAMLRVEPGNVGTESMEMMQYQLLDLKGGWGSAAWASQIMWVNLFLAGLHLLPTVPFDMRAVVFAIYSLRYRTALEPEVFRRISVFVSRLACFMLGVGVTAAALSWRFNIEIVGWYASLAAAVYLFVAGQWESARADELDDQYAPIPPHGLRGAPNHSLLPHLQFRERSHEEVVLDTSLNPHLFASDAVTCEPPSISTDIDEILRKLHREGRDSLSLAEQQALLSASRELKERRGPTN